jgi:hypothetical protein
LFYDQTVDCIFLIVGGWKKVGDQKTIFLDRVVSTDRLLGACAGTENFEFDRIGASQSCDHSLLQDREVLLFNDLMDKRCGDEEFYGLGTQIANVESFVEVSRMCVRRDQLS